MSTLPHRTLHTVHHHFVAHRRCTPYGAGRHSLHRISGQAAAQAVRSCSAERRPGVACSCRLRDFHHGSESLRCDVVSAAAPLPHACLSSSLPVPSVVLPQTLNRDEFFKVLQGCFPTIRASSSTLLFEAFDDDGSGTVGTWRRLRAVRAMWCRSPGDNPWLHGRDR